MGKGKAEEKEVAPPAEEEEDDEEAVEEGEGEAAKKKKKRRPKKKKGGEADAADEAANGDDAAPAEQAVAEKAAAPSTEVAEVEEDEGDDDDAEGEDGAAEGSKKKRKKKKKKPKAVGDDAVAYDGGAYQYVTGGTDEEFAAWCTATLEATANESEKLSAEDKLKPPQAFYGYKYTGDLRPSYVTKQLKMPEDIASPDYALDADGIAHSERERKREKEVPVLEGEKLATMREACRLGREILDIAARFMRVGVTGDEIDRIVYQACKDRKIYPSPLNYYRFPKAVCVSANEVICHGIPDCRPIVTGDIVNLDISICYNGFHSDLNETFFMGECDEESQRLVRTAYCALYAASQLIKPGTFYRDLGNAIHTEAARSNCSVVTTYCGHGVGELFHGPPSVPHYRKNKAIGIMKPGHVFTVEPMINLGPNGGDKTWPDNWTAVTKDGNRSAQFEHTFLVTETGCEVLTCRVGTNRAEMPAFTPAGFQR